LNDFEVLVSGEVILDDRVERYKRIEWKVVQNAISTLSIVFPEFQSFTLKPCQGESHVITSTLRLKLSMTAHNTYSAHERIRKMDTVNVANIQDD
jgi:hypothetical protein